MTTPLNTSERGWTKGPWEADADSGNISVGGHQIASAWVPRHGGEHPIAEREANARLIAAAPDLYEALAALRQNIGAASLVKNPLGIELRAQADAALAKAQGQ